MHQDVVVMARRFRDRVEHKGERHGLVYSWWIAVVSALSQVLVAALAVLQRDAGPGGVLWLSVLLVAAPYVVQYSVRWWVPSWLTAMSVLAGTSWLLATPVVDGRPIDFAPVVLTVLVAEVAATDRVWPGLLTCGASIGALVLSGHAASELGVVYVGQVPFGLVIGYMLQSQTRALTAERAARTEERARATLAERQRVAREIHDLVGHSLSVTMLHVTAARRALTEDADVPEAVEALTEAERIGRAAMTDIRRTVGVLASEPTGARPLPGVADLDDLVADLRTAGMDVDYSVTGDVSALAPAAGLAVFRVAQESLANVLKHEPGAPARVLLEVDRREARLRVSNPLPVPVGRLAPDGSGLSGMAARAEQLGGRVRAGRDGEQWLVDLRLPVGAARLEREGPECLVRRVWP